MPIGKSEELKKQVTEKLQNEKIAEMKQQLARDRQVSRAATIDELEKGRYTTNAKGEKIDRWEELKFLTQESMKMEGQAYVTWASSMFSLIEIYYKQSEALHQDLKEFLTHFGHTVLDGTTVMGYSIPGLLVLTDTIGEKLSAKPEIIMPKLQYLVDFTDDNKIEFKKLQRWEGDNLGRKDDTLGKTIDDLFEEGVGKWLDDRNYKPSTTEQGKWLNKDTGAELTKAEFTALKNDPDTGLGKILSAHFDVDLEESPRPSGP